MISIMKYIISSFSSSSIKSLFYHMLIILIEQQFKIPERSLNNGNCKQNRKGTFQRPQMLTIFNSSKIFR